MLLAASLLGDSSSVLTRRAAATDPVAHADSMPRLATFLTGEWSCRGGTPAGRVMNGHETFRSVLGQHWLEYSHVDDPPGRYQARALWPVDSAPVPLATTVYDNFGGARRFDAVWQRDSIVWVRDQTEHGARAESFTFRAVSADRYHYSWHVARTPGGPLSLGDSATCLRVPA